jgi:hypothetical protein
MGAILKANRAKKSFKAEASRGLRCEYASKIYMVEGLFST